MTNTPTETTSQKAPKSAAAISAFVLAIVALVLSLMPIINNFAFIFAIVGLILGIVGIAGIRKKKKSGMGIAIASVIISVVACIAVLASQAAYSAALDEAGNELDKAAGNATEEILGNDVDVQLGDFSMKKDGYGMITSSMPVTVTNLTDEPQSYIIEIEAVNSAGDRVTQDTVYANDLGAGQSQTLKAFNYVSSDDYNAMKSVTFKIMSVSQF